MTIILDRMTADGVSLRNRFINARRNGLQRLACCAGCVLRLAVDQRVRAASRATGVSRPSSRRKRRAPRRIATVTRPREQRHVSRTHSISRAVSKSSFAERSRSAVTKSRSRRRSSARTACRARKRTRTSRTHSGAPGITTRPKRAISQSVEIYRASRRGFFAARDRCRSRAWATTTTRAATT